MKAPSLKALLLGALALMLLLCLQLGLAPSAQAQGQATSAGAVEGTDFDHNSTGFVLTGRHRDVRCETCHVKGQFQGTPKDCASCHGWTNPRANTVMPTNHIPTGAVACETCHTALQGQFQDATRTFSHALAASQSCLACHSSNHPHPNVTTNPINPAHLAILNSNTSCSNCHSTQQFTAPKKPSNHIPTANVACSNCHTTTDYTVMPNIRAIHAFAPTPSSNCMQCHSTAAAAAYATPHMVPSIVSPPSNHIPMNGQSCEVCHVGSGSSIQLPVSDGANFENSLFSHTGIRSGCATCHGPNVYIGSFFGIGGMVQMPPTGGPGPGTHIPTSASCETCHSANVPTVQLPVNSSHSIPGSGFQSPAPTAAMIHTGITGNCASCHESPNVWLGVDQYPISTGAPYTGFQTRPQSSAGTYYVADPTHPTTGDCSNCHSTGAAFSAPVKPSNHIPTSGSAACTSCHKATSFSVMPSLTDIHANIPTPSSNCAQCHSNANAAQYAMATMTIVSPPAKHIDMGGLGCESCHVGVGSSLTLPVVNGASFGNSAFSHSGISSGCANCHGPGISGSSFYGVNQIVVMPTISAPSASSHLPTSTTCEICHLGSKPGALVPANATASVPGSGFQSPAPTAANIHLGAVGNCASCHDSNYVWLGMGQYPITTSAPYRGFQTRPQVASSGTFFVQDALHPVTGECGNCHASQTDFTTSATPANHIPVSGSAVCTSCHKSGDFSVMPSVADIHANIQNTSANCVQCHSSTNAATYNSMASMVPQIVTPPSNHIAMGALSCESCHVGAGSSMASTPVANGAKFSNALFSHSGISSGCDSCHGASVGPGTFYGVLPKTIASLSPAHLPTSAACETCHSGNIPATLAPSAGMTTFAGTQFSHSGITSGCAACHGPGLANSFYGVSQIVMPPSTTPGTSSHLPTVTTCESCHLGSKPSAAVPAIATNSTPGSDFRLPAPSASAIHAGASGSCASCHDTGMVWMGMSQYPIVPTTLTNGATYTGFQTRPQAAAGTFNVNDAVHPASGDCANCHGSLSDFSGPSKPSNHIPTAAVACTACHTSADYSVMPTIANIHLNAPSVSSGCATCHSDANAANYNSMASMSPKIVAPPGDHIDMGGAGCESCHVGTGSSIAATPVPNGARFSGSLFNHSGATATCASCHGKLVGAGTFYGVTPKSMGSLTPAHLPVPNSTPCDSCHINSVPTGLVPATGMATFAGAQFSHSTITGACADCHGPSITGSSFYGVSRIIVMPSSSTPGATSHIPSSTTCENCHTANKPSGLVPGVATASVPGSGFRSPAPTSSMIHTGITGNCASCHETPYVWLGMDLYPASQTLPYTGFQTRPQSTAGTYYVADSAHPQAGDCSNCHGNITSAFASPSKPSNHIPSAPTAQCSDCHTGADYSVMPSIFNIHVNAPSTSGGCDLCHSAANAATYAMPSMNPPLVGVPAKHIDMGGLGCEGCHVGSNSSLTLPVKNTAKFSNSAFSHSGITSGCASCHGATVSAGTFYGVTPKTIGSLTPAHVPVQASMACETCHVNNVPATLVPLTGASGGMTTFAGAQFSHSGITTGCVTCHGPSITGASFYGISQIVVMPPMSTPGTGSHLPTSTTCENCHLGNLPSGLVPGVAAKAAPGSGFLAPLPTATMIHANASGACTSCHETNMVWMGMDQYPITTSAPFKGFQTRPQSSAGTFFVADAAHPSSGNCANCHASLSDFTASAVPANHIPIRSNALCTACHTSVDFSVMPTIANIHANAPSSSTNCAQCHSAANAAVYNTLASMNPKIKAPSATHVDMAGLGCESCHVSAGGVTSSLSLPVGNSAAFSNSAFNHNGATAGCSSCHGNAGAIVFDGVTPKSMAGLSPVHVPTSLSCESCHNSAPTGLIPLTGGTGANTFAGGRFSHAGISSGCDTCHGANITNSSFYGVTRIVVLPATSPSSANSHIPSPVVNQCEVCHQGSMPGTLVSAVASSTTLGTTQFKTPLPSGSQIHTGVNASCSTCHEQGMSWLGVNLYSRTSTYTPGGSYVGYQARPFAAGTGYSIADASHPGSGDCSQCHGSTSSFQIDAKPANHIPVNTASACTTCHTNITASNPDFSVMPTLANIHANAPAPVTSNCASCHSAANAATYAIPANGFAIKAPDAKHVPFGAASCESCHVGVGSSMTTAVVGNGASFAGSLYSHSGVTSGCATCHGPSINASSFTGISAIVVAPPSSTQGASSHIPYSAACEACHLGSTPSTLVTVSGSKPVPGSGFQLPKPTGVMIHSNSSGYACKTCHEANYRWMGVDQYPISPTVVTTGASYNGFQTRPVAAATQYSVADSGHTVGGLATGDCSQCHGSTTAFTAAGKPDGHMPTSVSTCSTCHGADYSIATLASLSALHTNITSGLQSFTASTIGNKTCTTCHVAGTGGTSGTAPFTGCATQSACTSPPPLNTYQPMVKEAKGTHVPIGNTDCNGCHGAFTAFSGMNMLPGSTTPHNNVKLGGVQCQQCHERGMSWYGVSNLKTRPSGHSGSRAAPNDCGNSGCHDLGGFRALVLPIMREAQVSPDMARIRPDLQTNKPSRGSLGNNFDHKGVLVGQCKTCHDGRSASGMPVRHLMVSNSCDTCHRTTTWTPAQFNHSGVSPNTCMGCHNGMGATGKPAGHFMTARSCDACHRTMNWKPVYYQHLSPAYQPSPDLVTCISCHITNGEIIPRQMRGLTRTRPIPVGP